MILTVHAEQRAEWDGRLMRCAVGRSGFSRHKREGDGATPLGVFPMREVFYRADRLAKPTTALPCRAIADNDGWCDDPTDPHYNCLVTLPYVASHERMKRDDALYDLVVVLGYNDNPVVAGLGSAIFLHVVSPDFSATEGCVALELSDLQQIVAALKPGDEISITPKES
jgi:L,D-peptidoglycan transpeptidase YkuD (ErfK/YbiS/YcfS/YnhG family)